MYDSANACIVISRNIMMFLPYVHCEVHEIIPYKEGKETSIAVMKTMIELAKK